MTALVAPHVLTACVMPVTQHVLDIVTDLYIQSMAYPMLQCRYKALYNTKLEYWTMPPWWFPNTLWHTLHYRVFTRHYMTLNQYGSVSYNASLQCMIQSVAPSTVLGIYNACHDTEPVPFSVVYCLPYDVWVWFGGVCITPAWLCPNPLLSTNSSLMNCTDRYSL